MANTRGIRAGRAFVELGVQQAHGRLATRAAPPKGLRQRCPLDWCENGQSQRRDDRTSGGQRADAQIGIAIERTPFQHLVFRPAPRPLQVRLAECKLQCLALRVDAGRQGCIPKSVAPVCNR